MEGGLHEGRTVEGGPGFELWHNAFSLCSKKVRMCMAELDLPYVSHHIDLIETGSYETLSRRFLAVNPAALVPVLVHDGHPVYESHEILRYAALHSPRGDALVAPDEAGKAVMDEWIRRSSLYGDDPVAHAAESAGCCVPGLTIPLFTAMIVDIPTSRILEGLLFHRLKQRPVFFLLLKAAGLGRLAGIAPLVRVVDQCRRHMASHLDALEQHLATAGTPWIAGARFTLADVSWAVILDRLREGDWRDLLEDPRRPLVASWWQRVQQRPAYAAAMQGTMEHPLVREATRRIAAAKAADPRFARVLYGIGAGNDGPVRKVSAS